MSTSKKNIKVAIVHYWLVGMRGGEKVLDALCELFPEADIFTHVVDRETLPESIKSHRIHTSFIATLPRAKHWYQKYLPLMPLALEQLDLRQYDLVISSESGPAKGIIVGPDAVHVCYCHTPMRYIWDMYLDYLERASLPTRLLMRIITHYLRVWDVTTAARVDHFITNSRYVASRVWKYYRRDADVIHPPVDTSAYNPSPKRGDFYLTVGQLVPYKRVDLAVAAFNEMGKSLIVIGDGEEFVALRRIARSNVSLLGWQPSDKLREFYAECRALVFPGLEDFGIVPVEAMASGRPVIAYGRGGALDSVVDGVTGILFEDQTPASLIRAVGRFEEIESQFDTQRIVQHARGFDREVFKDKMRCAIARVMERHQ